MSVDILPSPLRAFHGDSAVKAKYLARVEGHMAADHLIRGTGWNGLRGCAVGCTLETYQHSRYSIELGIPEWLARVEDTLFEGMSHAKAMMWPRDFLAAISEGADLDTAKGPFLIVVLRSTLANFDQQKNPQVLAAVQSAITLWERSDIGSKQWEAARSAAESAARSVAWSAVGSAAWSAARNATWSAAQSAVGSVAESAARSATYDKFADALLGILGGIAPAILAA